MSVIVIEKREEGEREADRAAGPLRGPASALSGRLYIYMLVDGIIFV